MMFPDTITVYNKHTEFGEEAWQRTVLRGVYWNAVRGAVARRTGVQTADGAQILIPFSVGASRRVYKPPGAWRRLDYKKAHWTLQPGDTVVKGESMIEIDRSTKELLCLDDVLTITSIDTKDFGGDMSHFEVSAK